MRFLLFNIVVAGALVFLFSSDRADLHAAADRAHDAANGIKSKAFEVIGAGETVKPGSTVIPVRVTEPAKPVVQKQAITETGSATATPKTPEETFSQNKPLAPAAADAIREVQVATRNLVKPAPVKSLPPEVEQRREEVLAEGIIGGTATGSDKFMSASTRKRDLMLLSEEMELFSARSISR